jgi:DNA-binding transcriptional LysR family regulator
VVRTAHSEEIVDLVIRREVHAGLGRQVRHPQLAYTPIYDDELVLVSAPAQDEAQTSLSDAPLILFDRASSYYELTTALIREAGVKPRGMIELDNIEAAKRMVAGGLGVALLPRTSVAAELEAGTLSASRFAEADPQPRHIGVIRRADAGEPSPSLAAFLDLASQVPALVLGARDPS